MIRLHAKCFKLFQLTRYLSDRLMLFASDWHCARTACATQIARQDVTKSDMFRYRLIQCEIINVEVNHVSLL